MEIKVAGAGAGKTTNLAQDIANYHHTLASDKNIYCLAFTNNAVSRIESKLSFLYGQVPTNIKVSTIHSFLFQELIRPYYFLLYGEHYHTVSIINLPPEDAYKAQKIRDLCSNGLLHMTAIPERAKWVVSKKSSDKKREKELRKVICDTFSSYCAKIYVDEAQDIDAHMKEIFIALDGIGIELSLVGDPKQDLHGYNHFRELIQEREDSVHYINECHRCPEIHLKISNSIVNANEQQTSYIKDGSIKLLFENDVDINSLLKEYDLTYIYRKNNRIDTHMTKSHDTRIEQLRFELSKIFKFKYSNDVECELYSYNCSAAMVSLVDKGIKSTQIMNKLKKRTGELQPKEYATIIKILTPISHEITTLPVVNSIEGIKGLEGENCLFILTPDLAAYLFQDKTEDNKIKNALYVGLTRSLRDLSIMITTETEEKYTRQYIENFFESFKL